MSQKCLMYPSLQKFYNALSIINQIDSKKYIFETIPQIDSFFSEMRNITFVMQKSFNSPELKKVYEQKRDEFLSWLFDYEWVKLGLPAPDKVIYLCQPPEVSFSLIQKRCDETGAKKDIHEKDSAHLYKSYEAALYVSEKYGWDRIDVSDGMNLRTREDIHQEVIQKVSDLLNTKE